MEPAEWAAVAAVTSAVVGAGSQVMGGLQSRSAGGANMQIAQDNANLDRAQAQSDAADMRVKNRKALGSIRANAGANGLLASEGSPLEGLLDSAATGELNVSRRIWQGDVQALRELQGGALSQQKADAAATGSFLGAGASLLTGASKAKGLFDFGGGGKATSTQIGGPDGFGGLNAPIQ